MALLLFAFTLFVSAFLLFLVQPIIGKMILPKLGGTPQVWNTCMVFFQTALLAGYAYTHTVSTRLTVRRQVFLHCLILFVPFLILLPNLPFNITGWIPPPGANPIPSTLWLLTMVVGVPFIVVATSAPLLQKWFGSTGHPAAADPYFLYGASNLGSMLALVAYPLWVEPYFRLNAFNPALPDQMGFDITRQPWLWTAGYALLVVMILCCAVMVLSAPPSVQLKAAGPKLTSDTAGAAASPGHATAARVHGSAPPPVGDAMAAVPPPSAPSPAAPAPSPLAPAATTSVTSAAPKPNPAHSFKKGSKQQKKGKHQKHQQQQQQQQPATRPSTAVSSTPLPPAPSGPLTTHSTPAAPTPHVPRDPDAITPGRRLRWVALAAVPSSLMLGVTTYISTDISAITLFWVLPLSLYLLSFIFVFMRWPINWIEQAHTPMLYIQPPLLALLALVMVVGANQFVIGGMIGVIAVNLLAFFATALVCHGELAKDRPSTKHLTEFYLWMSVGGMVGGMFNGLLAPVLFPGVWEFGMAIFVACLVRPRMLDFGWTEQLVQYFTQPVDGAPKKAPAARHHHHPSVRKAAHMEAPPTTSYALDVVLPLLVAGLLAALLYSGFATTLAELFRARTDGALTIMCGVPVIIVCLFYGRPLRFALGIGAILLIGAVYRGGSSGSLLRERSYFGVINVVNGSERVGTGNSVYGIPYVHLMHGTTDHGMNFYKPDDKSKESVDYSRLATTYYHRLGPVGIGMEKFNWFGGSMSPQTNYTVDYDKTFNTYWSDVRMPISLLGGLGGDLMVMGGGSMAMLPLTPLVDTWSEPPYATIGLGTGTMASYARPYQILHFYEIDDRIKRLSLPKSGDPYFTYLKGALDRGADVRVLMGDARLRMAQPWNPKDPANPKKDLDLDTLWEESKSADKTDEYFEKVWSLRGGPDHFYHLMVVDAFSSDAIPVHLITQEAIAMYMSKLVPNGVLCVHTSNRHVELVPVVAKVANSIHLPHVIPMKFVAEKDSKGDLTGKLLQERANAPEPKENPEGKEQPLFCKRGHDNAYGRDELLRLKEHIGHYTSEWVLVARDKADLSHLYVPDSYAETLAKLNEQLKRSSSRGRRESEAYWREPELRADLQVWTDDYSNLLAVFRWHW